MLFEILPHFSEELRVFLNFELARVGILRDWVLFEFFFFNKHNLSSLSFDLLSFF